MPAEFMKKPDVVVVYNSGMNGVNVNACGILVRTNVAR